MKEIVLLISLVLLIVGATIYWSWYQERETKSLIKRIQNMALVAFILSLFGYDNKDNS
jgi:predicted negative regulator of RcsB-dependent stress response